MTRSIKWIVALLVATPFCGLAAQDPKPPSATKHKEVVEFTERTEVSGVTLEGKYLLVHDEEKAPKGEACFFLYKHTGNPDPALLTEQPVVTFHCTPVERKPAKETVLTVGMSVKEAGLFELREIQFAGTAIGHRVAVKKENP
jgi:hypothetical protein